MLFRVSHSSVVGLANQIAAQIRGAVASGELTAGDRLPAARDVAAGLGVNMHTVLRGYAIARDEGLLDVRRGRGAIVRSGIDVVGLALRARIHELAESAVGIGWSATDTAAAVFDAVEWLAGSSARDEETERTKQR